MHRTGVQKVYHKGQTDSFRKHLLFIFCWVEAFIFFKKCFGMQRDRNQVKLFINSTESPRDLDFLLGFDQTLMYISNQCITVFHTVLTYMILYIIRVKSYNSVHVKHVKAYNSVPAMNYADYTLSLGFLVLFNFQLVLTGLPQESCTGEMIPPITMKRPVFCRNSLAFSANQIQSHDWYISVQRYHAFNKEENTWGCAVFGKGSTMGW